jgi:hypothetical protein
MDGSNSEKPDARFEKVRKCMHDLGSAPTPTLRQVAKILDSRWNDKKTEHQALIHLGLFAKPMSNKSRSSLRSKLIEQLMGDSTKFVFVNRFLFDCHGLPAKEKKRTQIDILYPLAYNRQNRLVLDWYHPWTKSIFPYGAVAEFDYFVKRFPRRIDVNLV